MKIPSPKEHEEKFKVRQLDIRQLNDLRRHIIENLDANGHVDEHVIDISRFDEPVVDTLAKECVASGWIVSRDTDKDKSTKLVLRRGAPVVDSK